ncbi:phosphatase PAP2 family protein [Segniliparus rugosus]|uniref:Phosphatidic acid phosphatase type 2/haloperoxidase domain-containing protein n=1 Tax=Segniliparus rugosus (strain ATCC BAA-974 / DSM 45345 / CCUG 50838 / CIP 108380 / JCM 13579 / CDC 945) TaxID=679197 RepID=E5XUN2_SEGRC|nr:phosphatase PAP2 family protein [Segniliparus rugosus]EFV11956.2 hypothetical protein HMPREF9336_03204 [Segniliparus rugosus ATCC BAA-974]
MTAPAIDQQTHDWFVGHRLAWLNPFEKAITLLGSTTTVVLVTMVIASLLLWRARASGPAAYLTMTITLSCLVLFSVKTLAKRHRPPDNGWLVNGPGYSFPSGHATLSAALATALIVLAVRRVARAWVWPVIGAGVLFSLFIGISRLYLGVHWLTDVLAGWTLGTLIALGTGWVMRGLFPKQEKQKQEEQAPSVPQS